MLWVKCEILPMKVDTVTSRTSQFIVPRVYIISSICHKHANFPTFAKVDNLFTKQLLTSAICFLDDNVT